MSSERQIRHDVKRNINVYKVTRFEDKFHKMWLAFMSINLTCQQVVKLN